MLLGAVPILFSFHNSVQYIYIRILHMLHVRTYIIYIHMINMGLCVYFALWFTSRFRKLIAAITSLEHSRVRGSQVPPIPPGGIDLLRAVGT